MKFASQTRVKQKSTNRPSGRLTVRLCDELLAWVQQQGGSSFVRTLLTEWREIAGPGQVNIASKRGGSALLDQWEQLTYEYECIREDRLVLREEERSLDRYQDKLDKEREVLRQRREQLEDEWGEFEMAQVNAEERELVFTALLAGLAFCPAGLLVAQRLTVV